MKKLIPVEFAWDVMKAENERLLVEVSNLKLANEEARKTIDRLNTLIPREANDAPSES